jgi:hypothetical protein
MLEGVTTGDERLWNGLKERDAIHANPDPSDADYVHAAELQAKVAELDGYFWRGTPSVPDILLLDQPIDNLDINIRCPRSVLKARSPTREHAQTRSHDRRLGLPMATGVIGRGNGRFTENDGSHADLLLSRGARIAANLGNLAWTVLWNRPARLRRRLL